MVALRKNWNRRRTVQVPHNSNTGSINNDSNEGSTGDATNSSFSGKRGPHDYGDQRADGAVPAAASTGRAIYADSANQHLHQQRFAAEQELTKNDPRNPGSIVGGAHDFGNITISPASISGDGAGARAMLHDEVSAGRASVNAREGDMSAMKNRMRTNENNFNMNPTGNSALALSTGNRLLYDPTLSRGGETSNKRSPFLGPSSTGSVTSTTRTPTPSNARELGHAAEHHYHRPPPLQTSQFSQPPYQQGAAPVGASTNSSMPPPLPRGQGIGDEHEGKILSIQSQNNYDQNLPMKSISSDYHHLLQRQQQQQQQQQDFNQNDYYGRHHPLAGTAALQPTQRGIFPSTYKEEGRYRDFSLLPDPVPDNRRNRGGVVVPFPEKLHQMLSYAEEKGLTDIVSFFPHGRAFAIHKPGQFVSDIMPKFFKQSVFTSFQRQVNLYGFHRISQGPDSGGYYHELFLRGRPGLCINMKRTKIKGMSKGRSDPEREPNFYSMPPIQNSKEISMVPTMKNDQNHAQSSSPSVMTMNRPLSTSMPPTHIEHAVMNQGRGMFDRTTNFNPHGTSSITSTKSRNDNLYPPALPHAKMTNYKNPYIDSRYGSFNFPATPQSFDPTNMLTVQQGQLQLPNLPHHNTAALNATSTPGLGQSSMNMSTLNMTQDPKDFNQPKGRNMAQINPFPGSTQTMSTFPLNTGNMMMAPSQNIISNSPHSLSNPFSMNESSTLPSLNEQGMNLYNQADQKFPQPTGMGMPPNMQNSSLGQQVLPQYQSNPYGGMPPSSSSSSNIQKQIYPISNQLSMSSVHENRGVSLPQQKMPNMFQDQTMKNESMSSSFNMTQIGPNSSQLSSREQQRTSMQNYSIPSMNNNLIQNQFFSDPQLGQHNDPKSMMSHNSQIQQEQHQQPSNNTLQQYQYLTDPSILNSFGRSSESEATYVFKASLDKLSDSDKHSGQMKTGSPQMHSSDTTDIAKV